MLVEYAQLELLLEPELLPQLTGSNAELELELLLPQLTGLKKSSDILPCN